MGGRGVERRVQGGREGAFRLARICPANASWNSITSMSFSVSPACLSTRVVAYVGPSSSSSKGSHETNAQSRRCRALAR